MKFIICDDLSKDRELLKAYIVKYAGNASVEYAIYEYASAESLLADYNSFAHEPCILFLDIYMGNISGMDAALSIFQSGFAGSIIFTTMSINHAIDSYKVAADGYLKKPYAYEDFLLSMERCFHKLKNSLKTLNITSDRLKFTIYRKDIVYIETGDHCCFIHANGTKTKVGTSISALEQELADEQAFLRCHRSYIINLNMISLTENDCFIMKNNDRVLYSIRDRAKIKKYIADYFWTQTRRTTEN